MTPTGDRCSWSYSQTINFEEANCGTLKKQFEDKEPNLKIQIEQNGYTYMSNPDNGLAILMVESGDQSCTIEKQQAVYVSD